MSELDRDNLAEEFDIDNPEIEIETFREVLSKAKEVENPDNVLMSAIEKAGRFLDMVERESVNGNMSARMAEVASALINTLVTASNSLTDMYYKEYDNQLKKARIDQRDRELDQRDKELEIKKLYYENKNQSGLDGRNTNNNLVIASREDVMKVLQQGGTKEINSGEEQNETE